MTTKDNFVFRYVGVGDDHGLVSAKAESSQPPRFPSPGYKRAIHRMIQILLLVRADEDEPRRRAFRRAGGDVVCEACGREYREHVDDPIDPWLTVLCSGDRVKL